MSARSQVIVTGSEGFIGSHLTEELVKRGHKVRAFVCYNSFNSWGWLDRIDPKVLAEIEVIAGDVRDAQSIGKAIEGCETVFHLAALIAIPFSYSAPELYIDTNVKGTLNVLQACARYSVQKLVHTSTSEVYGSAQYVPMDEKHQLNPQSPYAASKVAADHLAQSFYLSFGLPVATIRPFNAYGPRQSARAVIPSIIIQLAARDAEIDLGALEPTRDFTYVQDTARGFIAVAESNATTGEVVNVGSRFEVSIGQTAETIARLMGRDLKIRRDPARDRPVLSEVTRLWCDNQKAEKLAGWTPEYAGLEGFERGLKDTINWFSEPQNLSAYKSHLYNV